MNNDRISNRIRRLRFDHNEMTQQELADKAGVTRQTILAIEAGKYSPSLPLAFRIARAFRATVEEVFVYEDDKTPSDPAKAAT
ncbi:MAG TPA: helix-turn-helix transcriptional regulator [Sedimentisphaerales bacterium]|jgi:putative transcriptional regulator|nr:helix-turn-helix transcriptional regulator [Sedimentisphaerales bacterium]HNU30739.1 helix-turn-helix transcriptional regulator [Sedimentisphaerales bacterium]